MGALDHAARLGLIQLARRQIVVEAEDSTGVCIGDPIEALGRIAEVLRRDNPI